MAFNLINFKKGTTAGLATLKQQSKIEEGTFYLTIDNNMNTSRLFIGTGAQTALPVNHSIITVTDTTALNNTTNYQDGDFAYVTTGNILAVRIGGAWKQINTPPGASDFKYLDSVAYNISVDDGVATIEWDGTRSDNQHVKQSYTIEGDDGVTVSATGSAITISGDPATLASNAVANNATSLTLSSTRNTASGSVTISGGTNVTLSGSANSISIAAKDTKNKSLDVSAESAGFKVQVVDSDNNPVEDTIDPVITYLTNEAGTTTGSVHFVSGTAALPVYSKDEINRRLSALDGMTYRGTVGTNGSAGTTVDNIQNPAKGDTFKVVSDLSNIPLSSGTGSAKLGDLLIANGTETNGVIISGLYYDIIPSGNDIDTQYSVVSDTNGIKIHNNTANTDIGSIKIAQGNQIAVSDSGTTNKTVTIAHGTISSATDGNPSNATAQTQSNGSSITVNAVTGLTTNNGHVTAVEVTPYTIVDTNASLTSVADSISTANNKASITTAVTLTSSANNAVTKNDTFSIGSDNLTVTSSGKDVTMNFVWGSF